jgi:hypothetical protein
MKDDTFATFRTFLENEGLVDFAFDFWIPNNKKRLLQRFKRFNVVGKRSSSSKRPTLILRQQERGSSLVSTRIFLTPTVLHQTIWTQPWIVKTYFHFHWVHLLSHPKREGVVVVGPLQSKKLPKEILLKN